MVSKLAFNIKCHCICLTLGGRAVNVKRPVSITAAARAVTRTGKPCGQAAGRDKVARQAGHMTRQAASAVARNQSVGGSRRHDAVLD